MRHIWILGRGGLLGSALSRALWRRGIAEHVPSQHIRWASASMQADMEAAVRAFAACAGASDWIIHWAAGTGTMGSTEEELASETTALTTLLDLLPGSGLDMARGTLTFAGSAGAVYAGCIDDEISEHSAPAPLNAYGREKLRQEECLSSFSAQHPGLRILLARISNLYGAGQARGKKQGLLTHIARCTLRRTPINIFVPFDTIRDYIHVDDAAESITIIAVSTMLPPGLTMKIIASERPVSIAQIIGTFRYITRVAPRVMTSTSPLAQSYRHRMKFRSHVLPIHGPQTSLLVGIADVMHAEKIAMQQS